MIYSCNIKKKKVLKHEWWFQIILECIVLFSQNVAFNKENTCSEAVEDVCSGRVCLQLLPSIVSSKEFCFYHCRGQKLSCVSAHFDKYVGSSIFIFIMKSSSNKGNVDKHSISIAVGCILSAFWGENNRTALINTSRVWFTLVV